MPRLTVMTLDGSAEQLNGEAGISVMKVIRNGGVDELLATCGGECSCGTCHVYVDAAWLEKLPRMKSDEDDLLSDSSLRRPESRLSCQLPFQNALDGLTVSIAPQD